MALWYASAPAKMLAEEIDFLNDDVRATLHTSTYALDRLTHEYEDDLTDELADGDGYTQGGEALTTKSVTTTAADSWTDTWQADTEVTVDEVIRPTTGNGFLYRCVTAGTTGSSEPTWPTTIGEDVADDTAVWECVGRAIVVLDWDPVQWTSADFTGARYMVIADYTPGTAATNPLIGIVDFGSDQDGQGGTFEVVPDAQGSLHLFIA